MLFQFNYSQYVLDLTRKICKRRIVILYMNKVFACRVKKGNRKGNSKVKELYEKDWDGDVFPLCFSASNIPIITENIKVDTLVCVIFYL